MDSWFTTQEPRIYNGEKEKLDSHKQKNETRPLSYTIQKNQLKMD